MKLELSTLILASAAWRGIALSAESSSGECLPTGAVLAAAANRPDSPLFDGGYAILEVREITAAGFAGDWRSAAGSMMTSGHFCARRAEQ